jgi:threonine/homoserine/homoserine lactone efflux protein
MLRLIGLAVSIGLADSLNPSTIGPALYLASGERPRERVLEFTLGVFFVYLLGGLLIALGPGQLLISLVHKPDAEDRHVIEIAVGAAMMFAAIMLWRYREPLAKREAPDLPAEGRSSAILGATISAVELPTAFPYFAVLAAIIGSGLGPPRQVVLLVLFNVCFILPLLGIVATLTLAPERADKLLSGGREFLERRWPLVLAGLLLIAGMFVLLIGVSAFGARGRGRFGRLMRHVRHFLPRP